MSENYSLEVRETYTKDEVMYIMEVIGSMYKYNYEKKLWNMQTTLAPGMLHEGTEALLNRLNFGMLNQSIYYAEQRKNKTH